MIIFLREDEVLSYDVYDMIVHNSTGKTILFVSPSYRQSKEVFDVYEERCKSIKYVSFKRNVDSCEIYNKIEKIRTVFLPISKERLGGIKHDMLFVNDAKNIPYEILTGLAVV